MIPAAAIAGASVVSGLLGAGASSKAGKQAAEATREATAEQRRQFDLARGDLAPYRETGYGALDQMAEMQGLRPARLDLDVTNAQNEIASYTASIQEIWNDPARPAETKAGEAAMYQQKIQDAQTRLTAAQQRAAAYKPRTAEEMLSNTPGYQFRLSEGNKALDRFQSARRVTGGRAVKEAMRYGQDYASNEFGANFNRSANIAGMGQGAVNTGVQAGQNAASNIGQYTMANAQAQGNAAMGQASSINNAVQGGMQNYYTMKMYNDLGAIR